MKLNVYIFVYLTKVSLSLSLSLSLSFSLSLFLSLSLTHSLVPSSVKRRCVEKLRGAAKAISLFGGKPACNWVRVSRTTRMFTLLIRIFIPQELVLRHVIDIGVAPNLDSATRRQLSVFA